MKTVNQKLSTESITNINKKNEKNDKDISNKLVYNSAKYESITNSNNNNPNNVNNANAVLLNQLLGLETNITKIFSIAFSPLDDYIGTGNFNKRSRIYKVINKALAKRH